VEKIPSKILHEGFIFLVHGFIPMMHFSRVYGFMKWIDGSCSEESRIYAWDWLYGFVKIGTKFPWHVGGWWSCAGLDYNVGLGCCSRTMLTIISIWGPRSTINSIS
jgi:hypothetical protein